MIEIIIHRQIISNDQLDQHQVISEKRVRWSWSSSWLLFWSNRETKLFDLVMMLMIYCFSSRDQSIKSRYNYQMNHELLSGVEIRLLLTSPHKKLCTQLNENLITINMLTFIILPSTITKKNTLDDLFDFKLFEHRYCCLFFIVHFLISSFVQVHFMPLPPLQPTTKFSLFWQINCWCDASATVRELNEADFLIMSCRDYY